MLLDQIFDYLNAQLRKSIFLRNFNVFVGCGLLFYFIILVVKILRPIFSKIPRSFDSSKHITTKKTGKNITANLIGQGIWKSDEWLFLFSDNTNSEELNEYFENNDLKPFLPKNDHVPFSGTKVTLSRGADEFFEVLNDRRSIRTFSRKKVDFNVIRKCIEAAGWLIHFYIFLRINWTSKKFSGTSPSGAHTEPWTFCVVEDQEMKVQIREVIVSGIKIFPLKSDNNLNNIRSGKSSKIMLEGCQDSGLSI